MADELQYEAGLLLSLGQDKNGRLLVDTNRIILFIEDRFQEVII